MTVYESEKYKQKGKIMLPRRIKPSPSPSDKPINCLINYVKQFYCYIYVLLRMY